MEYANFPVFFADAPRLRLRDPLAALLGAADDGVIDYRYEDAVRLAGHSCPTVAGAFLMVRAALRALYGSEMPCRGGIGVDLAAAREEGVAGVVGAVASLLTGAAESGGFRGIGGRFNRRNTLRFGVALEAGEVRLWRHDTGAAVEVSARIEHVPGDARLAALLPLCLTGEASGEQQRRFADLWQARVRRLLIDHADDPQVIAVHRPTAVVATRV